MNFFDYKIPKKDEQFDNIFEKKGIKITRIVSSRIENKKEFLQKENEWVIVLEGEALLEMNKKIYRLKKGDFLFIEANTPHKLLKTKEGTLWLAVHWKDFI